MQGGELYVPRIPSMKIIDLAKAVSPDSAIVEIGIRPGEKLHEEMISAEDSRRTIKVSSNRFLVLPVVAEWSFKPPKGEVMSERTAYASDTNDLWIDSSEMAEFIERMK
jgi:UDP-N-acetylglucosamine 4,6-dehydratase